MTLLSHFSSEKMNVGKLTCGKFCFIHVDGRIYKICPLCHVNLSGFAFGELGYKPVEGF